MATAVPAAIMGPISHGSVLEVFIGSGRGVAKARAVRCGGGHAVGGVGLPFAQLPLFHHPCGMLAVFVRVHEAARDLAFG